MKLSIVLPCYNEAQNITLILEKFNKVIKRNDIEIILVNNGSNDNSDDILNSLAPKYFFARTLNVKKNKGYGFGIITGLNETKGDFIGYMHADMQTDPTDIIRALEIIEKQPKPKNCFIKGNRKGRPFLDQCFTLGMSLFETIYLDCKLWDINAQPNIFHNSFYKNIKHKCPNDFSLDLFFYYMAQKKKLNMVRFDVMFPDRKYGNSKWNSGFISKWTFIKRTIDFSASLKKGLK